VNTSFAGLRGVLTPMPAIYLVPSVSMLSLGLLSAGMIVEATLLLLPEIKFGRQARPAAALIEEVSE